MTSSAEPAKGAVFADSTYHTCLVRVTDRTEGLRSGDFLRNDYSRRQAFNADNTRLLVYGYSGDWHLYDASTLAPLQVLPFLGGDAEPQWDPTDPNLLYYVPTNGGLELDQLNVLTGVTTRVGNFGGGRLPWAGAAHVWTKSEGSPSKDARYWCFMVDDGSFNSLGVFVWDKQADAILGTLATSGHRPDHVSMSPSGRHCVVSWDKNTASPSYSGTVSFSQTLVRETQVNTTSEHSDLAIMANGDDAYVSIDYDGDGYVFLHDLDAPGQPRTQLFPTYVAGTTTAAHISGKAFNRPGWAVVSTYAASGTQQWLHNKVFVVQLIANPTIYMLAFTHRVSPAAGATWGGGAESYWTEPQASVNRDFTRVVFNSNWENPNVPPEDYMIVLPANAIQ